MAEYAGEKNLEPTPHRRQQARREGHVAKSRDLGSAVLLLAGLGALMTLGGGLAGFLAEYLRGQLSSEPWLTVNPQFVVEQWNAALWKVGRFVLPIFGLICLAGVTINVLQMGFLFLPQRLAPDFSRLDPLQGLQRIFSGRGVAHLGFGIIKLAIALAVAGAALYGERAAMVRLAGLSPGGVALEMTRILIWTAMKVGAALLVLAVLDYAYQWWRHEQDLKMTPQELREELKNLEGNPQVLARRKQAQRGLAESRMGDRAEPVDAVQREAGTSGR